MGRAMSLYGVRRGKLTVVERVANDGRRARWLCRCDCGNTVEVLAQNLISRDGKQTKTRSCGCLRTDVQITRRHRERAAKNAQLSKERAKRLDAAGLGAPKAPSAPRWGDARLAADALAAAFGLPTSTDGRKAK